ncbi:hypothetical protein V8E54_012126 [Elaphomyces granulatus]
MPPIRKNSSKSTMVKNAMPRRSPRKLPGSRESSASRTVEPEHQSQAAGSIRALPHSNNTNQPTSRAASRTSRPRSVALDQERLVEQRDQDLSHHPNLHLELPQRLSGRRPRPY